MIDAFSAWSTLLDVSRQGANPSKTIDTKKGYRARLDADGKLMRADVVCEVDTLPDGSQKVEMGAGDKKTVRQLLARAKRQSPQLDLKQAEKQLAVQNMSLDDEIKLGLNRSNDL